MTLVGRRQRTGHGAGRYCITCHGAALGPRGRLPAV